MTHWTEAADLIGEREGAAQGFVSRYLPGALAFTLSAALGAYLVYLRPLMHAPAPFSFAPLPIIRSAPALSRVSVCRLYSGVLGFDR